VATLVGSLMLVPLFMGGSAPSSAAAASLPGGSARGGTVDPPSVGTAIRTSTALLPGVVPGGYPDNFPYGQCTYWAALNHRVTWSGNADEWIANAAARGVAVSSTPTLGAIAVYAAGSGYDQRDGHVAIVTAVVPGAYTISEMNYLGAGVVDARSVPWPDPRVLGFIP
jgi:hypothetical protein